jgi:hypothetical protein
MVEGERRETEIGMVEAGMWEGVGGSAAVGNDILVGIVTEGVVTEMIVVVVRAALDRPTDMIIGVVVAGVAVVPEVVVENATETEIRRLTMTIQNTDRIMVRWQLHNSRVSIMIMAVRIQRNIRRSMEISMERRVKHQEEVLRRQDRVMGHRTMRQEYQDMWDRVMRVKDRIFRHHRRIVIVIINVFLYA